MNKNHNNKFKTPEGYFENFNQRLFERLEEENDEPNTDFLPKSDGFGIPEKYFESVQLSIIQKLKGDST